jgi:hypothetical protein
LILAASTIMQSLVGLGLAGLLLEAGCLWIWALSPQLTAIYTPEFTREFSARVPLLPFPLPLPAIFGVPSVWSMVSVLEVGLLAMIAGYVLGLVVLRSASATSAGWLVLGFALLFRLTMLCLPGMFSTDIFSYVMYGRIAGVHADNPYLRVPADFPDDSFLNWVFPFWRDTATVYGPAWTDFSWLLGKLTGGLSNFDQVLAYRCSLGAAELLTLGLVWWLLGRTRPDNGSRRARVMAFGVFAWNPVVLFDLAGNAHNDTAMLLLLVVGTCLFAGKREMPGLVALTLSALVKYVAGIAVLLWAVAWAAQAPSRSRRIMRLVASGCVFASLTLALGLPWLQSPAALAPLEQAAGGRLVLNSAPDLVAFTIADQMLVPAGVAKDTAEANVRVATRALTWSIFLVYLAWEVWRLWPEAKPGGQPAQNATIRAVARALLVLPLLVLTWVWSWYFSWALTLAVLLGWGAWLTRLVVLYTLVVLPIAYAHQYLTDDLPGAFVLVFAFSPLAGWLTWYRLAGDYRHR